MSKHAKPSKAATSHDRETLVRQAAYALYEQQGCVAGRELEHWIAAEALVEETMKTAGSRPRRSAAGDKAAGSAAH